MRFNEFKPLFEAAGKFYTIGDSHAVAVATAGGKDWVNLAIGGRSSTDSEMLANINKIPRGVTVLVSQGANDTANAMRASAESKKPPRDPKQIAANVANVVSKVQAQGATVIFMLFPNGPGRGSSLAKYYGGDYQDDVRAAIKSAISVPIIDINGRPLTDGVHATMAVYKDVANQVRAKAGTGVTLGPSDAKPGSPATKDKVGAGTKQSNDYSKYKVSPSFDPSVLELQKELKAKGADLGPFGPDKDGLDGLMGSYTRRAAAKFPDIAAKYKDVLAKPNASTAFRNVSNIDLSVIQDPDFNKKLDKIAKDLGVKSNDLLAVMKQESGVNPKAQNKTSGATGLIQFMPKTAASLGTSTSDLLQMDAVQQLDYVYKYFKMTGVGDGSLGDLYMAVFMPKYVGRSDDTVLGQQGASGFSGKVYDQNKGLDRNKDGTITVADVKQSVARFA